jgi:hypothetical protein
MSRSRFALKNRRGWWYARFRMKWPEDNNPYWHIDLLLAREVIAPVLSQNANVVPLWRFHRRASRDEEGHQFSFIFYSTQKTAEKIYTAIGSNPWLIKMTRARIVQYLPEKTGQIIRPNLGDTSDAHWPPMVMKTWPYFIMGVCRMWLNLIDEIIQNGPVIQRAPSLNKLLSHYEKVNKSLNTIWQEQGGHAFLHHLNAIFGYESVLVHEWNLKRF